LNYNFSFIQFIVLFIYLLNNNRKKKDCNNSWNNFCFPYT